MSNDRAMTSNDQWGGRVYTHPVTGEEFRSVTTILGAANKPALNNWIVKQVANYALDNLDMLVKMVGEDRREAAFELLKASRYASSKEAADIGDRAHKIIEELALGNDPEIPNDGVYVRKMWDELNEEFDIEVVYAEATLINRTIGYAGSADLMVLIRRKGLNPETGVVYPWKRAIVDAKSGKSIYDSVALQLVAYAKAEQILLPSGEEISMPAIQETYALHVRPRSWALIPMKYDLATWNAFQAHVGVDRWIAKDARTAVGRAINAGAIARMRS